MPKTELRRVKVYELRGETWLDRGTGHCLATFEANQQQSDNPTEQPEQPEQQPATSPETQRQIPVANLQIREEQGKVKEEGEENYEYNNADENDPDQPSRPGPRSKQSLKHKTSNKKHSKHRSKRQRIRDRHPWPEGGGIYQRQQMTLVVWTEPDGTDMALSFATPEGCQEIWSFICDVQNLLAPLPSNLVNSKDQRAIPSDQIQPEQQLIQPSPSTSSYARGYTNQNIHSRKDSIDWDDDHHNPQPSNPSTRCCPSTQNQNQNQNQPSSENHQQSSGPSSPILNFSTIPSSSSSSSSSGNSSINPDLHSLTTNHFTHLPEPTLRNLPEIEAMIKWSSRSGIGRERVSTYIVKKDYISKLDQIRSEAEDLESLNDLHTLCSLLHTILLLNDAAIYEYCLQDETVLIVARILDYDPEFGNQKASYYADLSDTSRFKQVVPIRDESIKSKIHLTYRLQYFKDIILARILDDSTFSIINSMLFFNQVEIVQYLHSSQSFMRELFEIFDEPQASDSSPVIGPILPPSMAAQRLTPKSDLDKQSILSRKNDTIFFLQQLCSMAKHLQSPARVGFFRTLAERGVLKVIEYGLSMTQKVKDSVSGSGLSLSGEEDFSCIRSAVCEILMTIIDYDPNSVRGYCLKQKQEGSRNLVECLIELLQIDPDLGLKVQLAEAIRILVDTGAGSNPGSMVAINDTTTRREEDPDNERFLQFFYDCCVHQLAEPILKLPDSIFRAKYFILSTNILKQIKILIESTHSNFKFLQLTGLRLIKIILIKKDEFYDRSILKHNLVLTVLEVFEQQNRKDNLISSACLEFFENIRMSNPKAILNHMMEKEGDRVRKMSEISSTFKNLIIKWEQNNEPPPQAEASSESTNRESGENGAHAVRNIGNWSRTRTLDAEEESYFNNSDEDDSEDNPPKVMIASTSKRSSKPMTRKRCQGLLTNPIEGSGSDVVGGSGSLKTTVAVLNKAASQQTKPLVDYQDEEDDSDQGSNQLLANSTSPVAEVEVFQKDTKSEVMNVEDVGLSGAEPPKKKLGERRKREEDEEEMRFLRTESNRTSSKREKRSIGMVRSNGSIGVIGANKGGGDLGELRLNESNGKRSTSSPAKIVFSLSSNKKLGGTPVSEAETNGGDGEGGEKD
ncbi:component of IIS longevity pathway SMK-1-domain-containing protein [Phakopsora pachyrhizi]|nr:component of IIS longevity pathway SMK-1-domain-containing protein [Phakopsora pachyrhizi]